MGLGMILTVAIVSFFKELAYRKEIVRADLINKKVGIRYALASFIYLLLEGIEEQNTNKSNFS